MEEDQKELQLLPPPHSAPSSSRASPWQSDSSLKFRSSSSSSDRPFEGPHVDLQLSISVRPIRPPRDCTARVVGPNSSSSSVCVEALRWQAAEQIRIAATEKAYAERLREMTKREMELAQTEFSRARQLWERAREEVEKAEKMKEMATARGGWPVDSASSSTCMEITCQACRQKFRP